MNYVRRTERNLVLGTMLRLPSDPPSFTLNPKYNLTISFQGTDKGTTLKVSDILSAVAKRLSLNISDKVNGLEITISAIKIWSLKPASVLSLTVYPVIGWSGTRQFTDSGNSIVGARIGYSWPRDALDQFSDVNSKANTIASVFSTHDFIVHCHVLWRVNFGAISLAPLTLS